MSGRCEIDPSVERHVIDGFAFPLGVYPVEPMTPISGYTVAFEPADGGEDDLGITGNGIDDDADTNEFSSRSQGEEPGGIADPNRKNKGSTGNKPNGNSGIGPNGGLGSNGGTGGGGGGGEMWPDRYVYEIVVPANRLAPLCRALFSLLPPRVFPILEFLGHDEYREVDPYVSYDLIGLDRFLETVRRLRGFFFEDGLVGFGAMSEDPFVYLFVDEHKVVTVRVEPGAGPYGSEALEKVLSAFDLEGVDAIAAADAATHEHRTVLLTPDNRTDLLNAEEIVEDLQDEWGLVLNIDPTSNLDDEGNPLGITPWRCIVRAEPLLDGPPTKSNTLTTSVYAEVLLTAANLEDAEIAAIQAVAELPTPPELEELVERKRRELAEKKAGEQSPLTGESQAGKSGGPRGTSGGGSGTGGNPPGPGQSPGPRSERHKGPPRRDPDELDDYDDLPLGMLEDDTDDPFAGLGIDEERGLMFTLVSADRVSRTAFRNALPKTAVERVLWNIERVYRSSWL